MNWKKLTDLNTVPGARNKPPKHQDLVDYINVRKNMYATLRLEETDHIKNARHNARYQELTYLLAVLTAHRQGIRSVRDEIETHPSIRVFDDRTYLQTVRAVQLAVDYGYKVFAGNENYKVIKSQDEYLIHYTGDPENWIGLTGLKGTEYENRFNMTPIFIKHPHPFREKDSYVDTTKVTTNIENMLAEDDDT